MRADGKGARAPVKPVDAARAQASAGFQHALALLQRGNRAQAMNTCKDILRLQPRHFDALHLAGLLALQSGNPSEAARLIGKAVAVDPTQAAAWCNRGSALRAMAKWAEALSNYDRAIAIEPRFAEAHYNRAAVLRALRRFEDALAGFDSAIALNNALPGARFDRALALHQLRRWDEALTAYDEAIAANSRDPGAHCNRGLVLKELGRPEAALASFNQAIALNPDYADAYSNRGNALRGLQQWDAAVASYDRAIAIKADCVEAHANRGNVLNETNRLDAAIASYDRALAIKPDHVEAHCNKAVALLLKGDLEQGWIEYAWRRKRQAPLPQPLWDGAESIAGKTILLHCEQGYGDTLLFCRYAKWVAARGAEVVLDVQRPLQALMTGLDGVSRVVAQGDTPPAVDFHCSLLSLPLAFKTTLDTIPGAAKYLTADPHKMSKWQARLGAGKAPRVGLTWAGSAVRNNNRQIPLSELLAPLPDDIEYFGLQKEMTGPDDAQLLADRGIANFADDLEDFADTAALCACMDVVVSVDTGVAHLSGALGKTTWILLPFNPDWRWLLDRADSPWYPSATLCRQHAVGAWGGVLDALEQRLQLLVQSHPDQ
jgi:tetratricopeptide (TPR) repeat protein